MEMRKVVLAAACVVALAASPAFAQSYDPDIGTGNLNSAPYTTDPDNPYADPATQLSPYGAYGFAPSYGAYDWSPFGAVEAPAPVVRHKHRRHDH
jgi:hypothetical protein